MRCAPYEHLLPADVKINCEYLQKDAPVVGVMMAFAGTAIFLCVGLLVLIVRNRGDRIIEKSQPLLYLILLGSILVCVSIFLIRAPTET